MEEPKEKGLFEKLFSTQGILIVIACLMAYWIFFKDDGSVEKTVYDPGSAPIGVSSGLNQQAVADLGADLTENLDPKLIPSLVQESLKETAQSGVAETEFVPTLVKRVSDKVQSISTIDLNSDGVTDPVMILPQNFSESGEHFELSIRIPDPTEVSSFPSSTDQDAWKNIADNQSIEIMTTAVIRNGEEMLLQTTPNQQMYPTSGSGHAPYYHRSFGLGDAFLTAFLVRSMFAPPLFSPFGFGGGMPVGTVQTTRQTTTQGLSAATPSQEVAKSKNGKEVGSKTKPASRKATAYTKRSNQRRSGTGFGRQPQSQSTTQQQRRNSNSVQRQQSSRTFRQNRQSSRRSGFGRRGGFGRRR